MNDDAAPQAAGWTNVFDWLWHIFASPRLTVLLLVWVAVVLALSGIIPQAPSNIEDPTVRSLWLANLPSAARLVVERLLSIGVFDLLDTVWLRLPLVLLLVHALVALANSGRGIWHRVRCCPSQAHPLGHSFQLERDWHQAVEHAHQHVASRLREAGYRISPVQQSNTSSPDQGRYVASRWRWSWLGLAGIYLGLALISVGLNLADVLGEKYELSLAPSQPSPLPISALESPDLVLEKTSIKGDDPLKPASGVVEVTLSSGVGESQDLVLTLHNSRLLRSMWLTLTDLVPMVELTAVDLESDDRVLLQPFSPRTPAQEMVRVSLTGDPETRFVGVPSKNVTLHISFQADVKGQSEELTPDSVFSLSFYRGADSTPSEETSLKSGDSVDFDGVSYQVVTFNYDARLRLFNTLWWMAAAAGWGVIVLSFITLVFAPPVYTQGNVVAAGTGTRITIEVDVLGDEAGQRRELERLLLPPEV